MGVKCLYLIAIACLYFTSVQGSFIKVKNVPRVGRSNEADAFSNGREMAYVIKTMPKNNIPRMGRRNFDLENHYDIPKLNDITAGDSGAYEDDNSAEYRSYKQQLEAFYGGQNAENEM